MLKIKDNVDLKELEKFGFKAKYNEDTGEIKAFEKHTKENEEWRINSLTDRKSVV